jgi:hypothetical protein
MCYSVIEDHDQRLKASIGLDINWRWISQRVVKSGLGLY